MAWQELWLQVGAGLTSLLAAGLVALVGLSIGYLRTRWAWLRETRVVEAVETALLSLITQAEDLVVTRLKAAEEWDAETGARVKREVLDELALQLTQEQKRVLAGLTDDLQSWLSARLQLLLDQHRSATQKAVSALARPPLSPLQEEVRDQLG